MIEQILDERGARYGSFESHATMAQTMQEILWGHSSWESLALDTRQSLVVLTDKLARVLNADPKEFYDDNWVDMIGYSTLAKKPTENEISNEDFLVLSCVAELYHCVLHRINLFDDFVKEAIMQVFKGIAKILNEDSTGWSSIIEAAKGVLSNEHFLSGQRHR